MQIQVTISGNKLMHHNGQLADPLNAYTKALKAVSSKKKKTDEDHLAMAKAEFQGGLYHNDELGPFIPGDWIQSALIEGSRAAKLGKAFAASVECVDSEIKLAYKGTVLDFGVARPGLVGCGWVGCGGVGQG